METYFKAPTRRSEEMMNVFPLQPAVPTLFFRRQQYSISWLSSHHATFVDGLTTSVDWQLSLHFLFSFQSTFFSNFQDAVFLYFVRHYIKMVQAGYIFESPPFFDDYTCLFSSVNFLGCLIYLDLNKSTITTFCKCLRPTASLSILFVL